MNVNGISRSEIDQLVEHRGDVAISIYLPGTRKGSEALQGSIKLKNMLVAAEAELVKMGMRPTRARDFLKPVQSLLSDKDYWNEGSDGIALFLGDGFFATHHLAFGVPELLQIGDKFNILPLVPALTLSEPHYVLALDQHNVRMLLCGTNSTEEANIPGMPRSLASFLSQDYAEKQSQAHTAGPVGYAGALIRHGAGDKGSEMKDKLHRFCQAIDGPVRAYLHSAKKPLILAGTDEMVRQYRAVCKYPNLLAKSVNRSLKTLRSADIRKLTQPIADEYADRRRREELERYRSFAGTGMTTQQPEELREFAHAGKVEGLFALNEVLQSNGAEAAHFLTPELALINDAALDTLANHGNVFMASKDELQVSGPAAGILRY